MAEPITIPATLPKTIECFRCGIKARVRKDATLARHGYRQFGTFVECEKSGTLAPLHAGTFRIIQRTPKTVWLAECACEQSWTGAKYGEVESLWADHNKTAMAQWKRGTDSE